jgi:hypothetical protein
VPALPVDRGAWTMSRLNRSFTGGLHMIGLRLLDLVDDLFAIPHDWPIVEKPIAFVMRRLAPRTWAYYGNPLCYAYTQVVAPWFYERFRVLGERALDEGETA